MTSLFSVPIYIGGSNYKLAWVNRMRKSQVHEFEAPTPLPVSLPPIYHMHGAEAVETTDATYRRPYTINQVSL